MKTGQFILTGTSLSGDRSIAFLKEVAGGKFRSVRKGEQINGMLVAEVKPDRVRLTLGGDSEELVLKVAPGPKATATPAPATAAAPGAAGGANPGVGEPPVRGRGGTAQRNAAASGGSGDRGGGDATRCQRPEPQQRSRRSPAGDGRASGDHASGRAGYASLVGRQLERSL